MAKENVHEMKVQDNGQALKDALESIRNESFCISEEMSLMAAKADMLADIDLRFLSEAGKIGLVSYLREMAENIRGIQNRLCSASVAAHENL